MKIKYIHYLLVSVVILTISVSVSSSLIVAYFKADQDWVSAVIGFNGNIIGGILGGYIAYFVARYQIDATLKSQKGSEMKELINTAFLLKEEIKNNSLTLDSIITSGEIDTSLIKYDLSREAWVTFSARLANRLDEPIFISLNTIYRKIQVFQSMLIDEDASEISLDNVQRLKYQFDDCVRKIDVFIKDNS